MHGIHGIHASKDREGISCGGRQHLKKAKCNKDKCTPATSQTDLLPQIRLLMIREYIVPDHHI